MRSMIRLIALMLVCCAIGWAQSDRGSITGTITDSTGGIVPRQQSPQQILQPT
jgi:hypothetical protein